MIPAHRKEVARERYRGRTVTAHHVGPDLIAAVDGEQISETFYVNARAAISGGQRYIDAIEKAKAEKEQAA